MKEHVIWTIDPEMLDEATRDVVTTAQDVFGAHEEVSVEPDEELMSSGSQSTTISEVRAQSHAPAHRVVPIDAPSLRWVQPAYPNGSEAEFFSCTHHRWMIGKVSLEAVCTGRDHRLVTIIYNMRLGFTGQIRQDVPLHLLRMPLCVGELVEVGEGSSRPWVIGRITKVIRNPMDRHFEVLVAGRPRVVPAKLSRRHFPLGSSVFVYRGHSRGWVPGHVDQCSSLEPPDYSRFESPRHEVNLDEPVVDLDKRNTRLVIPRHEVDLDERVRNGVEQHGFHQLRIRFPSTSDPDDWCPAHLVKSCHEGL